jgi:ethanolamine transporter EutH
MGYRGPSIITIIYVAIGVIVASDHHYFSSLDTAKLVAEMVLAVILWPLLLFGVDFRF